MSEKMTRQEAIDLDNDLNWKKLRSQIDAGIASETEQLIHGNLPIEQVVRLQERIKALRFVTRLPSIVAEREEEDDQTGIITGPSGIITGSK